VQTASTSLADPDAGAVSSVSVVVPVFNSAESLDELHDRVAATLSSLGETLSWELILVNDGSEDESWEGIVRLSREHPEVRGLDLAANFGQHNALLAGIDSARHDVIVTLDDDLQDQPEEIPRLLEALTADTDLVYGKPVAKQRTLPRRIATKTVRGLVAAITAGGIPAYIGGFRAFRAPLLEGPNGSRGPHIAIDTLLARSATGIAAVSVQHKPRRHGRSNYTFGTLTLHTLTEFRSLFQRRGPRSATRPTYVVRRTTPT
jgi:undecaprenyl-phosphate 4-deoxy-4-formamido-L-arabinose transferase